MCLIFLHLWDHYLHAEALLIINLYLIIYIFPVYSYMPYLK